MIQFSFHISSCQNEKLFCVNIRFAESHIKAILLVCDINLKCSNRLIIIEVDHSLREVQRFSQKHWSREAMAFCWIIILKFVWIRLHCTELWLNTSNLHKCVYLASKFIGKPKYICLHMRERERDDYTDLYRRFLYTFHQYFNILRRRRDRHLANVCFFGNFNYSQYASSSQWAHLLNEATPFRTLLCKIRIWYRNFRLTPINCRDIVSVIKLF